MPYRRILVPTDFSATAERAAALAAALARRDGAELTLLHVSPMADFAFMAVEPIYLPEELWERLWDREVAHIQRELDDLQAKLERGAGGELTVRTTYRRGDPAVRIAAEAREGCADLIVMGTRGAGGGLRHLFGGVAEAVARTAPCPVLLATASAPAQPPSHALACIDYSAFSEPVLEQAAALVGARGTLTCLHVWQHPPLIAAEPLAEFTAEIERARAAEARRLAEFVDSSPAGDLCAAKRFEIGSPARTILETAEEVKADVIALGSHGRRGVERIIGTVADRVLRNADVPVLMVPEASLEGGREAADDAAGEEPEDTDAR